MCVQKFMCKLEATACSLVKLVEVTACLRDDVGQLHKRQPRLGCRISKSPHLLARSCFLAHIHQIIPCLWH
jgi:hypothetical protein